MSTSRLDWEPPEDADWLLENGWYKTSAASGRWRHPSVQEQYAGVRWAGRYWAYTKDVSDAYHMTSSVVEAATILLLEG